MNRLPPVTSISTILVTVTLPIRHFIAPISCGATQLMGAATREATDYPGGYRLDVTAAEGLLRRGALGGSFGQPFGGLRGLDAAGIARQVERHGRAAARLAVDRAVAAGPRHKAVNLRQTEPGALAGFLGRVERVERLGADLFRHAAP